LRDVFADPDCLDHLASNSTGLDLVLELPLRPLVDRSAPRLADADIDARHLRVVEPVEQDEV